MSADAGFANPVMPLYFCATCRAPIRIEGTAVERSCAHSSSPVLALLAIGEDPKLLKEEEK